MNKQPTSPNLTSAELAARLGCSPPDHPYALARVAALPYAKAIVAARELPARFNQADVWHAVGLEVGCIASTAIAQRRTVENVVGRMFPEIFAPLAEAIEALAVVAMAPVKMARAA